MAEERTYQGHVYRRNSAGEPWVIAGPAGGGGSIIVDQYKQNDERRKDDDQAIQHEQLRISQANLDNSQQTQNRETGNTSFNQTLKLRADYDAMPGVKEYRIALPQLTQGLKTAPDAAGDNALIYAYAKAMDPGSVVRESEMTMAGSAGSWLESAAANLKKQLGVEGGGQLSPDVRSKLRREMLGKVTELNRAYNVQRRRYETDAKALGIDPERVIGVHDGQAFLPEIEQAGINDPHILRVMDGAFDDPKAPAPSGDLTGGVVHDTTPNTPPASPPPGDYRASQLGQGMSGINEGIASTLGLPVDLTTMGLNLIPKGINAIANTDLPMIEKPFMGSDWFKGQMGDAGMIYAPNDDGTASWTRRAAQSVGSSLIPAATVSGGVGKSVAALLAGAGGGAGAATAQQIAPGNPLAEMGGELLGGGLTGVGLASAARGSAQRQIEAAIPTVSQLKEQAGELYRKAEATGTVADPQLTQGLSDTIRKLLRDDGKISPTGRINETYPKAKEAVQLVDDYAGLPMNPRQMQTVRSAMADGMTSQDANERRIAKLLTDSFDDWSTPLAPELEQARDVSSRYLNAQKLETARELAGADASQFSGSGFENALRTRYRQLDRAAIQGRGRHSDEVLAALQDVSRGTAASNAARAIGRLAPTTPWNIAFGTVGPAAMATAIGGPAAGVATGTAATALGIGGRALATKMGVRNADVAELIARNGGAIEQAPLLDDSTTKLIAALLASQSENNLQN